MKSWEITQDVFSLKLWPIRYIKNVTRSVDFLSLGSVVCLNFTISLWAKPGQVCILSKQGGCGQPSALPRNELTNSVSLHELNIRIHPEHLDGRAVCCFLTRSPVPLHSHTDCRQNLCLQRNFGNLEAVSLYCRCLFHLWHYGCQTCALQHLWPHPTVNHRVNLPRYFVYLIKWTYSRMVELTIDPSSLIEEGILEAVANINLIINASNVILQPIYIPIFRCGNFMVRLSPYSVWCPFMLFW